MTTVVVFGGTGFLGRRVVHRLVTAGAIVHVAVRHPEGARRLTPPQIARFTFFRADVRDNPRSRCHGRG
jgi:NADH dehydrogenase